MSYSMAFKNMTKYQLECKLREIRSLHKTEIEKLEKERDKLKDALNGQVRISVEIGKERDHLKDEVKVLEKEHDIQVESYHKVTAENDQLRKDLCAKEESNKKLADQFYAYREELVKCKNEARDLHNKYDGITVELAGVRGALNRQSELRVNAENKAKEMEHLADDLEKQRKELEDWKTGQENNLKEAYRNHDELSNKAWKWDKIHELVNAHGIDTMSKLKDALVELEHKREDVESLKTSLADSCAAKIKEGRDLTSKIKSLKEDLKKTTDSRDWYVKEAAKLRGWYDNLKKLYDKARKEGEEGCTMWREGCWELRDERDRYKKIYEAAARKNDELQCEVNRLTQKVQDLEKRLPGTYLSLPRPDDEICGRKIKEWMGYHAVLVKYGIPSPESLDAKLDPFEPARLTATRSYNVMVKYGINDEKELDESLKRLERFQQMLRDWHFQMIDEFSTYVNGLHNYKIICEQNLIGSTDELKKSLDELKTFRLSPFRSLGTEWRDVFDKYGLRTPDELENLLAQRQRIIHRLCGMVREEIG